MKPSTAIVLMLPYPGQERLDILRVHLGCFAERRGQMRALQPGFLEPWGSQAGSSLGAVRGVSTMSLVLRCIDWDPRVLTLGDRAVGLMA